MRPTSLLALLFTSILLVMGCAPKATSQSDLDTPEYHFRLGVRSLDTGDYSTAASAFQRAVDLDKKFARGWGGLGLAHAYLNTADVNAEKYVDRGVKEASKDPEVWVFRGRYWTVVRDTRKDWLEKAMKDFQEALKLNGSHEGAEYYLGEAYFYGLNFRMAESQFSKVVTGKGALAGKADEMWATTQKIVRARPGTDAGRKIAIKARITRADLAVLFSEELKLKEVYSRIAPAPEQAGFQAPGTMTEGSAIGTPNDVQGHWAEPWIKEVLELGVFELDPSGNFLPVEFVTRVEYALAVQNILIRATRDETLPTRYFGESPSRFSDVPSSHFAYNAMALCAERGIMKADMMTGQFDPGGMVGGADALLIIREIQNSLRITF